MSENRMRRELSPRGFVLDRRIPVALLFTVFMQMGAVVWWASTTQAQDHFRDTRLQQLELYRGEDSTRQEHIVERLARLEEQSTAQLDVLRRIEAQLARRK